MKYTIKHAQEQIKLCKDIERKRGTKPYRGMDHIKIKNNWTKYIKDNTLEMA